MTACESAKFSGYIAQISVEKNGKPDVFQAFIALNSSLLAVIKRQSNANRTNVLV